MLARYYLKRRDVSELLLKFDFFIIADVIAPMKYCCYYGHQCRDRYTLLAEVSTHKEEGWPGDPATNRGPRDSLGSKASTLWQRAPLYHHAYVVRVQ